MIVVKYVCTCGNKVNPQPQKPYGCDSIGGYCPIDKNIEMICGDCGKTMKIEITKVTNETKIEIIRKGDQT